MDQNKKLKVIIITTGGTIDKTYDEASGGLHNVGTNIKDAILSGLRLPYTEIEVFSILAKDSLFMSDEDRDYLVMSLKHQLEKNAPIIVLHGTDTMAQSAEYCLNKFKNLKVPIIFSGAMKPFGFIDADARQNVAEALMVAKIIDPGIYISFHGRLFCVPNVRKNSDKGTFEAC
ncbi:MAG: asparaginase [Bacteriovoracaceae bacterium]|nr:asparaginase [Bacteriovoracaceae bacterium]